jgi:hypothetical protein
MSKLNHSELYELAHAAGLEAANKAVLPEYGLYESDVFGNKIAGGNTYRLQGLCGFAWINIKPATSSFAKWLKASGLARTDSYYGGLSIWVSLFGQCVEKKEAYANAFASVLNENGIPRAYAGSRLD